MIRAFALLIAIQLAFASPSEASDLCILPVIGSEPIFQVEERQPYRLARTPVVIPGYTGLIVNAGNRHELYEIDGHTYRKIEDEFPHVWGGAYQYGIHILPHGDAIGLGNKPWRIYHLRAGTSDWRPLAGTERYTRAVFDNGSGDLYFKNSEGRLFLRNADGHTAETGPMPSHNGIKFPLSAIRTVPELNGTLAIIEAFDDYRKRGNELWFRPFGGDWAMVTVDLPDQQSLPKDFGTIEVDKSHHLLRLFHDGWRTPPLLFDIESGHPAFIKTAPAGRWALHPGSETWFGWGGSEYQRLKKSAYMFFKTHITPKPPTAYIIQRGFIEADEIEGLEPPSSILNDAISYDLRPALSAQFGPMLIRTDNGIAAFDGETVREISSLSHDRVGELPKIMNFGDRIITQSEKGVFLLDNSLFAERVDAFPIARPWPHEVSINYLSGAEKYIVVDRETREIFESSDMRDFTRIDTDAKITKFVAALPDRDGALLVGTDMLYTLETRCPGDE